MIAGGEVARKAIHIGAGFLALAIPWLTRWQGIAICLGAFLMNWLLLPRITGHTLERSDDKARGFAAGILLYPLSVGVLFLLFGSNPGVVGAAWGIMAFGDGFATLAGRSLGGPRLPWNPAKSFAGFTAFFLAGTAAATALYLWCAGPATPHATPAAAFLLCAAAALVAALVETIPTGVDDNLVVPLMAAAVLYPLTLIDPALLAGRSDDLRQNLAIAAAANLAVAALALAARLVKRSGAVAGFIVGTVTWTFGGWQAYAILILFFILATGATKVGYEQKAAKRIAQEEGGRRGARHAIANCGVSAFLAFVAAGVASPHSEWLTVGLVAAFATAVFDTVSSEIGQVYGRRPFLITTFRRVPPGTDGAVSVEGTLAGLLAAVALAAAAVAMGMTGPAGWAGGGVIVAAAFFGTTFESYLGAISIGPIGRALGRIDNEAMNFANTAVGALAALALCPLVLS